MSNECRYELKGDYAKKIAVLSAIYRLIQMYAVAAKIAQDESYQFYFGNWPVFCTVSDDWPYIAFRLNGTIELVTTSDAKCESGVACDVAKFESLAEALENSEFNNYLKNELYIEYREGSKLHNIVTKTVNKCLQGLDVVSHELESIRATLVDGLFSQIDDLPPSAYKKGKK